ncbi:hypothetical protein Phi46:3_gp039 [Cellulophaga phage phi46:3]|uniref:Uncharacterized protein n=1 Tax=Cellulophaga phage phi46:3 TaxID=1327985 RepID=S0A3I8_9CAUD|nr:hypothetical protein Phi46:3_gp039 [Cellulophaga phage phi46:3]AGO48783.1 hypothetical protein Phi46:3_gp039 [Cellulophaga phage phi46:3]
MENPKIKVKIQHSQKNSAWNIIGTTPGQKYKVARIPYYINEQSEIQSTREKYEALKHAEFIVFCFNNSDKLEKFFK